MTLAERFAVAVFAFLTLFASDRTTNATVADPVMMPWVMPQGSLVFNQPLIIEDMDSVVWRGYGSSNTTRIEYRGPPTKGVIQLIGCTRCRIQDFEIVTSVPGVECGVLICNKPQANPNGRISNGNVVENVRVMHGGKPTAVRRAFSIDSGAVGGNSNNNEHHRFIRCYAQSFTEAGFYLNGNQAHQIVFDQCIAHDAGGRKPVGLKCEDGAYFRWTNGAMVANSIDFKTNTMEFQSLIDGHRSEQSTQFFVSGRVGAESFVDIRNVTWDCQPVSGKPVIDYFGKGPVSITNSWFAGVNGICPTMRFGGSSARLRIDGLMLRQHGGISPTIPIVTAPNAWESSLFGVKHQYLNAAGIPTDKKIEINKAPGTPGVQ